LGDDEDIALLGADRDGGAERAPGQRPAVPFGLELDRVTRIHELQGLLGLSLAEFRAVLDTDDVPDRRIRPTICQ
jgi:hypothetical protein